MTGAWQSHRGDEWFYEHSGATARGDLDLRSVPTRFEIEALVADTPDQLLQLLEEASSRFPGCRIDLSLTDSSRGLLDRLCALGRLKWKTAPHSERSARILEIDGRTQPHLSE